MYYVLDLCMYVFRCFVIRDLLVSFVMYSFISLCMYVFRNFIIAGCIKLMWWFMSFGLSSVRYLCLYYLFMVLLRYFFLYVVSYFVLSLFLPFFI